MPRIFDNIDQDLLPALRETIEVSHRADFCVGYFNLCGWKGIGSHVGKWSGGEDNCCRLLLGMQRLPQEELREAMNLAKNNSGISNQVTSQLKKRAAEELRDQLASGVPTNDDEAGLRQLVKQMYYGRSKEE